MKYLGEALTFDDVALVPQYNNIQSRKEPNLETYLTQHVMMDIPILAANMDTVIGPEMYQKLRDWGSFPIWHRFMCREDLVNTVQEHKGSFMSIGLNVDDELISIYAEHAIGVCLDIAHGHDRRALELIEKIKNSHGALQVIAGNVCTANGYIDLVNAGADAVKVGIGPGAACTTRKVTGFGIPQFTAISMCAEAANKYRVPIIADGGIRNSSDISKALAAGACSVMMGKLFACTEESAALKRRGVDVFGNMGIEGNYARYRGQASEDFQKDFKGGLKEGTVAEGEAFWSKVTGSVDDLLGELLGGLRSAMTYGGARDIKEFQRKAEFVKVSPGYERESDIRE